MPTIYPLLKPHDWPHKGLVAHRVLSDEVEGVPIVAFGFDAGENYQFVPAAQCDDVEELYREALANLAALDYPWELGDSDGLPFAASSGREFSAERLLDRGAMLECHRLLEADRIVVAAPRRTCLFATRDGLGDKERSLFVRLVMYTYQDDSYGHAPISPALFVLEWGVIRGVMFAVDEPEPPGGERASKPWWKFWG
jgi:uncharacterized protein YtpQ (UPF0354 family)